MAAKLKLLIITGSFLLLSGCEALKSIAANQLIRGLSGDDYGKGSYCLTLKNRCNPASYQEWYTDKQVKECTCKGSGETFLPER